MAWETRFVCPGASTSCWPPGPIRDLVGPLVICTTPDKTKGASQVLLYWSHRTHRHPGTLGHSQDTLRYNQDTLRHIQIERNTSAPRQLLDQERLSHFLCCPIHILSFSPPPLLLLGGFIFRGLRLTSPRTETDNSIFGFGVFCRRTWAMEISGFIPYDSDEARI